MPQGLIVKALSGYYYVLPQEKGTAFAVQTGHTESAGPEVRLVQCRARGVFKKQKISPLVGDRVEYVGTENGEGTVVDILPRLSELIRPPIANAELAVLVFSVDEPPLNLQLLDKLLIHAESAGLQSVICFTKQDLLETNPRLAQQLAEIIPTYARIGYRTVLTSSKNGIGVEEVKRCLSQRISVFSGQSGVGKSSLLNAILPGLRLQTGDISFKLGRGKHTTRHVELIPLPNGGFVADTPGFSQLDFAELEPEQLASCFVEFAGFSGKCKFRGCLHQKEPGCKITEALAAGEIFPSRYEHYLSFLTELKEKKRRY